MRKELIALREKMKACGVDAAVIPTGDFHGSEYIHDYFKARAFFSGFTGSAGTLAVTQDWAGLWTDGRYFLQAGMQLKDSGIDLMKMGEPGVPTLTEKLGELLSEGMTLAFDGRVVPALEGEALGSAAASRGAAVNSDFDPAEGIWEERPLLDGKPARLFPLSSSGITYQEKIKEVRALMSRRGAGYHLITGLEENAWLYNLRGDDVKHTPVFFSFTLIGPEETALYVFPGSGITEDTFGGDVTVKEYFDIWDDVRAIPAGASLLVDADRASFSMLRAIPEGVDVIKAPSPATLLKAVKNPVEIGSTRNAHLKDGVAMVEFIYWLKKTMADPSYDPSKGLTEISASDYLEARRREKEGCTDLSVDTICGYMSDGAIIHYSATPETDRALEPHGFLLVDSGGQYLDGTTDITRTFALGPVTEKMKDCYTAVLKGHIQLAMAQFPDGVTGVELDKITRAPIRAIGLDYNHGTGHGVGHVLSVHEGPNNISEKRGAAPIIPGMITSDEPGVYLEGEFGIRIEGEILCVALNEKDAQDCDYGFEMLTLCPYEPAAIKKELLTQEELDWLNAYHRHVYEALSPHLSPEIAEWLKTECAEI